MKKVTITKIDKEQSEIYKDYSTNGKQKNSIAFNLGVLKSAKSTLLLYDEEDTFNRARVYNIIAQIEKLIQEEQIKFSSI